jgi:hypothetical protein
MVTGQFGCDGYTILPIYVDRPVAANLMLSGAVAKAPRACAEAIVNVMPIPKHGATMLLWRIERFFRLFNIRARPKQALLPRL